MWEVFYREARTKLPRRRVLNIMYISILEVIYTAFHVFYGEECKMNSQRALEDSVLV